VRLPGPPSTSLHRLELLPRPRLLHLVLGTSARMIHVVVSLDAVVVVLCELVKVMVSLAQAGCASELVKKVERAQIWSSQSPHRRTRPSSCLSPSRKPASKAKCLTQSRSGGKSRAGGAPSSTRATWVGNVTRCYNMSLRYLGQDPAGSPFETYFMTLCTTNKVQKL